MTEQAVLDPAKGGGARGNHAEPEVLAPIVVSIGKKSKKQIKRLKRGKGRAMSEVLEVVAQVQANLGQQAADKIVVPVVVVYRSKERRMPRLF